MAKLTDTQIELLKGIRAALGDMEAELGRSLGQCDETRYLELVRLRIGWRIQAALEVKHG